jgi:hypothetical protein
MAKKGVFGALAMLVAGYFLIKAVSTPSAKKSTSAPLLPTKYIDVAGTTNTGEKFQLNRLSTIPYADKTFATGYIESKPYLTTGFGGGTMAVTYMSEGFAEKLRQIQNSGLI